MNASRVGGQGSECKLIDLFACYASIFMDVKEFTSHVMVRYDTARSSHIDSVI